MGADANWDTLGDHLSTFLSMIHPIPYAQSVVFSIDNFFLNLSHIKDSPFESKKDKDELYGDLKNLLKILEIYVINTPGAKQTYSCRNLITRGEILALGYILTDKIDFLTGHVLNEASLFSVHGIDLSSFYSAFTNLKQQILDVNLYEQARCLLNHFINHSIEKSKSLSFGFFIFEKDALLERKFAESHYYYSCIDLLENKKEIKNEAEEIKKIEEEMLQFAQELSFQDRHEKFEHFFLFKHLLMQYQVGFCFQERWHDRRNKTNKKISFVFERNPLKEGFKKNKEDQTLFINFSHPHNFNKGELKKWEFKTIEDIYSSILIPENSCFFQKRSGESRFFLSKIENEKSESTDFFINNTLSAQFIRPELSAEILLGMLENDISLMLEKEFREKYFFFLHKLYIEPSSNIQGFKNIKSSFFEYIRKTPSFLKSIERITEKAYLKWGSEENFENPETLQAFFKIFYFMGQALFHSRTVNILSKKTSETSYVSSSSNDYSSIVPISNDLDFVSLDKIDDYLCFLNKIIIYLNSIYSSPEKIEDSNRSRFEKCHINYFLYEAAQAKAALLLSFPLERLSPEKTAALFCTMMDLEGQENEKQIFNTIEINHRYHSASPFLIKNFEKENFAASFFRQLAKELNIAPFSGDCRLEKNLIHWVMTNEDSKFINFEKKEKLQKTAISVWTIDVQNKLFFINDKIFSTKNRITYVSHFFNKLKIKEDLIGKTHGTEEELYLKHPMWGDLKIIKKEERLIRIEKSFDNAWYTYTEKEGEPFLKRFIQEHTFWESQAPQPPHFLIANLNGTVLYRSDEEGRIFSLTNEAQVLFSRHPIQALLNKIDDYFIYFICEQSLIEFPRLKIGTKSLSFHQNIEKKWEYGFNRDYILLTDNVPFFGIENSLYLIAKDEQSAFLLVPYGLVSTKSFSEEVKIQKQSEKYALFEVDKTMNLVPNSLNDLLYLCNIFMLQKKYKKAAQLLHSISFTYTTDDKTWNQLSNLLCSFYISGDSSSKKAQICLQALYFLRRIEGRETLNKLQEALTDKGQKVSKLLKDLWQAYEYNPQSTEEELTLAAEQVEDLVKNKLISSSPPSDYSYHRDSFISGIVTQISCPSMVRGFVKEENWIESDERSKKLIHLWELIKKLPHEKLVNVYYQILSFQDKKDFMAIEETCFLLFALEIRFYSENIELKDVIKKAKSRFPDIKSKKMHSFILNGAIDVTRSKKSPRFKAKSLSKDYSDWKYSFSSFVADVSRQKMHLKEFSVSPLEMCIVQDKMLRFQDLIHYYFKEYERKRKEGRQRINEIFFDDLVELNRSEIEGVIEKKKRIIKDYKKRINHLLSYSSADSLKKIRKKVKEKVYYKTPTSIDQICEAAARSDFKKELIRFNKYLTDQQLRELHEFALGYMEAVTEKKHFETTLSAISESECHPDDQNLQKIAAAHFCMKRQYNIQDNPFALFFEYKSGKRLRQNQVKLINTVLEKVKKGESLTFQLIMAGGKTSIILSFLIELLATSDQLVSVVCHHSQLASLSGNLLAFQKTRFGKDIVPIDSTTKELSDCSKVQDLIDKIEIARQKRYPLLLSSSFPQLLRNKFLAEVLKRKGKNISNKDFEYLQSLSILKQKLEASIQFIDECDSTLSMKTEVHLPFGKAKHVAFHHAELDEWIYKELLKKYANIIQTDGLEKISEENYQEIREGLAEAYLNSDFVDGLPLSLKNEKEALANFLKGTLLLSDNPILKENLKKELESKQPLVKMCVEQLVLLKQTLEKDLPYVFSLNYNQHYGPADLTSHIGKIDPYQGVGKPSGTKFGNPHIAYLLALQASLIENLREEEIIFLREKMYHVASHYAKIERKNEMPSQTLEGLQFLEMTGCTFTTILDADKRKEALDKINQDPFKKLAIRKETARFHVSYYSKQISSTPIHLVEGCKQTIAFSGTTYNAPSYAKSIADPIEDVGAEGSIVEALLENHPKEILSISNKTVDALLKVIREHPKKQQIRSVIDSGGYFKDDTNEVICQKLLEEMKHIEGIIYVPNRCNHFVLLKRKGEVISLANTSPEEVAKHQIPLEALFVFFDENRSTGTDFKLAPNTIFLKTYAKTIRNDLQASLRARGFFAQQKVQLVISEAEQKNLINGGKTIQDVIATEIANESISIGEQTLLSYKSQIDYIRQVCFEGPLIFSIEQKNQFSEIFYKDLKSAVVSRTDFFPYQAWLEEEKEVSTLEHLAKRNSKNCEQKEKLLQLAKKDPYLPKKMFALQTTNLSQEIFVEQEQEQEIELQQEIEQERWRSIDHESSFNGIPHEDDEWETIEEFRNQLPKISRPVREIFKEGSLLKFPQDLLITRSACQTDHNFCSPYSSKFKIPYYMVLNKRNKSIQLTLICKQEAFCLEKLLKNSCEEDFCLIDLGNQRESPFFEDKKSQHHYEKLVWFAHLFVGNIDYLERHKELTVSLLKKNKNIKFVYEHLLKKQSNNPLKKGQILSSLFFIKYSLINLNDPTFLFSKRNREIQKMHTTNLFLNTVEEGVEKPISVEFEIENTLENPDVSGGTKESSKTSKQEGKLEKIFQVFAGCSASIRAYAIAPFEIGFFFFKALGNSFLAMISPSARKRCIPLWKKVGKRFLYRFLSPLQIVNKKKYMLLTTKYGLDA